MKDRKGLVSLSKIDSAPYTVESVHRVSQVSYMSRLGLQRVIWLHHGDSV